MRMYPRPRPVCYHILFNWLIHAHETSRVDSDTICNTLTTPGLTVVTYSSSLGS
jgi:hypothetical protein